MTIGKLIFTNDGEERVYTKHVLDFDLAESDFALCSCEVGGKKAQLFYFLII